MISRYRFLFILPLVFVFLIGCGGSGSGGGNKGVAGTPLNVNVGDAPSDRIVSCSFTINSVVLNGTGVTTTALSKATEVEFTRVSGTVSPLSLVNATSGSYTSATVMLANPQVTIVDDLGNAVTATANLSQTTVTVPFSATLNTVASTLNLELNLAQSVTLNMATNPPSATLAPVFTATVNNNAAGSQTPELGGFQEVTGAVTGATASSVTLSVPQAGQSLTFNTDNNTTFNGTTGLAALQNGNIVQVNGTARADGTLLATRVSLQVATTGGVEAEGLVSSVTGSPATSLDIVARDASGPGTKPSSGALVSADVSAVAANKFLVNSSADLTGVTVPFDASHLGRGQEIELDADAAAANNLTPGQVQLRDGTWTGTITGAIIPLGNGGTQFTLALPSDSALVKLTANTLNPVSAITVIRQPSTELLNGVSITPNLTVRVRGPLFFDGANYTLVAVRMTTP